ncbi:MAG: hypothetical protein AAGG51_25210 [Cyanobacteria bacterium P01_G01_bin.54]
MSVSCMVGLPPFGLGYGTDVAGEVHVSQHGWQASRLRYRMFLQERTVVRVVSERSRWRSLSEGHLHLARLG